VLFKFSTQKRQSILEKEEEEVGQKMHLNKFLNLERFMVFKFSEKKRQSIRRE
jgi:hypothetical protein